MDKVNFTQFGIEYEKFFLSSGSEVRLLKRTGAPIHIQACIKAGSAYNMIPGQAHFVEHMLVSSTRNFKDKFALNKTIDAVGGMLEATTDRDFIRITLSIPHRDSINTAINILNEILLQSNYTEQAFTNEQSVILNEIEDRKNNPTVYLMDSLIEHLYPQASTSVLNLGTKDAVSTITLNDINKYIETHITSNNIVYILSGDIERKDFEDALTNIILPKGNEQILLNSPLPKAGQRFSHLERKSSNTDIIVGFRCDTKSIEELVSLYLVQLMSSGRTSRLIQELRYKRGLVYSGNTQLWSFNKTNILSIKTSTKNENVFEVITIILKLINELEVTGINSSLYEILKMKTFSHFVFNNQTSRQWLDGEALALRHVSSSTDDLNALSILNKVNSLDGDMLTENIRKYFNVSNAYIVTSGDVTKQKLDEVKILIGH